MEVIDGINDDWVKTLKEAEEKGTGVDLSEMMGKFSNNIRRLDQYFSEARERVGSGKKKFW
jgi:hypothetical protein